MSPWSWPRIFAAAILIAGFAAMMLVNLPGHLEFDSIRQLIEGQKGVYSNWHPPIMSWMLGIADAMVPGASPFVVFDAALAFGSILSMLWLAPEISWPAIPAAALVVALPQLFLFQAIVWKDMLFADACLAGFVLLAHAASHWDRRNWRYALLGGSLLFVVLAILSRQSGALVLPCAAMALAAIAAQCANWRRGCLFGASFLAVGLVFAFGINAALQLRATKALGPIEELEDLRLYDMAGMLKRQPDLPLAVLDKDTPKLAKLLREKASLYTPIAQDRLVYDPEMKKFITASVEVVKHQWWALVLSYPASYLAVRAEDFSWVFLSRHHDKCLVYAVGVQGPAADMRAAGLLERYDDRDGWLDEDYATPLLKTPAFSHPFFAVIGLVSLIVLLKRRRPADLAMAGLLTATMLYTLSYFVISIACEYRYLYAIDLSAIAVGFYLMMDFNPRALRQKISFRR